MPEITLRIGAFAVTLISQNSIVQKLLGSLNIKALVNHVEYEDYLQQIEQAELVEDIRDFDAISAVIERGDEELIPAALGVLITHREHVHRAPCD
jgi:hypothetical protein